VTSTDHTVESSKRNAEITKANLRLPEIILCQGIKFLLPVKVAEIVDRHEGHERKRLL
jgi:hypothetical protein